MVSHKKKINPLCEGLGDVPSELSLLHKTRPLFATVAYPVGAMTLYVHGIHHNFVEITKRCFCDGRVVYQIYTLGANCKNPNFVGDCINFFK